MGRAERIEPGSGDLGPPAGGSERTVPVRELNQRTSAVIDHVAQGHAVTITRHGEPVARLVPLQGASPLLDRLVAEGAAVAPRRRGPLAEPPDLGDVDLDVAAALVAERGEERW